MGLGQVTPSFTGKDALKKVNEGIDTNMSDKTLEDSDKNGTKVDELLKSLGKDGILDSNDSNTLYSEITAELNNGGESSIEDSSLRKVANTLAKLGGLNDSGFTKSINYKEFIAELSKEYKPQIEKTITKLNDGKPQYIPLGKSSLPPEMILASYRDTLNSYNNTNIQVLLASGYAEPTLVIYSVEEEYPYNKKDLDELINSIDD